MVAPYSTISRVPVRGETWRIDGAYESHPQYGRQLKATRCQFVVPRGRLLVRYLSRSKSFPGVGEATAAKLYDEFGEGLGDVLLASDVERLRKVISPALAAILVEGWLARKTEMELVSYLDQMGFEPRLADKLVQCWGDAAKATIDANPYLLLAVAGWSRVDAEAQKLGIARTDHRRLVGAIEAALYSRLNVGHTLTSHDTTVKLATSLVGREHCTKAIAAAREDGAIVGSPGQGYQPVGVSSLEQGIAARLRAMIAGKAPAQGYLFHAPSDAPTDALIAEYEGLQGIKLTDEQKAAIRMAANRQFSLVLGGAGVGKTTVLGGLIRVLEAHRWSILQLALAGRAAKRMGEATGRPAMTIAKFLLGIRSGKLELAPRTVLVVDEASMLDLPTLYRILSQLPDGSRLLLVGDPAQLPPIGFGLTFHRLATSDAVPKQHLTQVHRQAASTGIPAVAAAIRNHQLPALAEFCGARPGVSAIRCTRDEIVSALFELARVWAGDDWRVVGSVKNGAAGVNDLNTSFHHRFSAGRARLNGYSFAEGDPIVYLRNDYDRGLMNGSLGTVVEVHSEECVLVADFEGDRHILAVGDLADIDLAYAITCHKAQGSQFRRVAIPLVRSRLLDHSLIYTALTRGVEQVVLVGDMAALHAAIKSPPRASRREVGFTV
ncbi:exodeoxyribonuclease V [Thauera sp. 63]|nr:exodeoxyribonuclease V [Thauera sp. 63]